jgi:hypothetical protein
MPIEDNEQAAPSRRMVVRRSRGAAGGSGGFSGGRSTTSESLRSSDNGRDIEEDEADQIIDPEAQHRTIIGRPQAPYHDDAGEMDSGIPDPRARMNQVAMAGSQTYSKEYRLTLLHRLLMRRIPLDQIAKQLKVSVSTIEKDRVLLKQRLREESRALNIDEIVGGQNEVYAEISGMALRIASDTGNPTTGAVGQSTAMRLAAMRTALAAEADRTRFLNTAGVFDVLRYRLAEDGSEVSDVQHLMDKTNEMLERLAATDDEPAPKAKTRIRRTGGFDKFTMDDKNASSGDAEQVEL